MFPSAIPCFAPFQDLIWPLWPQWTFRTFSKVLDAGYIYKLLGQTVWRRKIKEPGYMRIQGWNHLNMRLVESPSPRHCCTWTRFFLDKLALLLLNFTLLILLLTSGTNGCTIKQVVTNSHFMKNTFKSRNVPHWLVAKDSYNNNYPSPELQKDGLRKTFHFPLTAVSFTQLYCTCIKNSITQKHTNRNS